MYVSLVFAGIFITYLQLRHKQLRPWNEIIEGNSQVVSQVGEQF